MVLDLIVELLAPVFYGISYILLRLVGVRRPSCEYRPLYYCLYLSGFHSLSCMTNPFAACGGPVTFIFLILFCA
jgi:hypothetical protein